MAVDDWFLTTPERGNVWTRIDRRHDDIAWTGGNRAELLLEGQTYFARLRERVEAMVPGDLLMFTDWRGDPDERLGDAPLTIAELFDGAARRGIMVKGLCWRSHLDFFHYSEAQNRTLADGIRSAGGEVVLDMRVPPLGSHHQKMVVLRHRDRPELDVAYVGGVDLCHTRRDTRAHAGDPQTVPMAPVWGPTPPWHDAMVEISGPAVGDIDASFRERWEDPTPLTLDPVSALEARIERDDRHPRPLPLQTPDPPPCGSLHVQVLRTYPDKTPRFPFAPSGERSVARGFDKAVRRAERLLHLEDQYYWSTEVTACFADALRTNRDLRMILVLPLYTTKAGRIAVASALVSRIPALRALREAGGDRVAVYGIENPEGTPVYVHTKVCVVDDTWTVIGSANINRRSWTYDTELSCAFLDDAGEFGRDVRLALAREHLDRADGDDADLVEPASCFAAFAESAARLDAWHAGGRRGPRPPGRLRVYHDHTLDRLQRAVGGFVYRYGDDPDGRPKALRGTDRF